MADPQYLRTAAYRLQQLALDISRLRKQTNNNKINERDIGDEYEALDLAAYLLKEVLLVRPEEPQSHRDLALVLAQRGELTLYCISNAVYEDRHSSSVEDFRESSRLLHSVVTQIWESERDIETPALMDMNHIIHTLKNR